MTRTHGYYLLHAVADLLDRGWTRCAIARSADGEPVEATDPRAVSWCVAGGFLRAATDLNLRRLEPAMRAYVAEYVGSPLTRWNDQHGQTAACVTQQLRACAHTLRPDEDGADLDRAAGLGDPIDVGTYVG